MLVDTAKKKKKEHILQNKLTLKYNFVFVLMAGVREEKLYPLSFVLPSYWKILD